MIKEIKAVEKELAKAGYKIVGDKVTTAKGDVAGLMDPYGTFNTKDAELEGIIKAGPPPAPKPKPKPLVLKEEDKADEIKED
tara:strand:- start:1790 stop:2035 length:246 start_codon:yes stop_codon:yes gene_type:complete